MKTGFIRDSRSPHRAPRILPSMNRLLAPCPLLRALLSCACALMVGISPAALPGHCGSREPIPAEATGPHHGQGPHAPEYANPGCHCVGACCVPHALQPAQFASADWAALLPVRRRPEFRPVNGAPAAAPRLLPFAIPPPSLLG